MRIGTPENWRVVRDLLARNNHRLFENDTRPFNLNIIGLRTPEPVLDEFGCTLAVLWKFCGDWTMHTFRITTFPGRYYLIDRLLHRRGCAILAPGRYQGAYTIAKHRGKYDALCQRHASVTVYRDGDRDHEFDLDPATAHNGMFGINIHRCGHNGKAPKVGKNSAGCQVFQEARDFELFMKLCRKGAAYWGNRFTYTLVQV